MADSIVRLRLDSKEYDANVKMARQGLLNLEETCKKTGSSFEKADKEQVAYVQSLGKMETSSKSLRGKIGELSSAYVDLASQYRRLTDAEKNSPYGRALSQSLDELRQRTMAAREELRSINSEIGDVSSGGNPFEGMTSGIMGFAGKLGLAIGAADLLASSIKYNIETAKGFEQSLSQLKSLTGVTSEELKGYADDAIRLGGSSTQTASQVVDAFKLIGSQKPDLLASREALVAVTEAAITLAEAATIEVPEAAAALTGALNQFGLAGSESSRVINALAAGSQKGAGDINYLNAAISKCGTAAAASGVSFEQAVGAIEVLAERIPDASTAGTNLRNVLLTLSTQANNDFNPKIVGLQQALENLGKAEMSDAEFTKLFGKENYNAAMILRDSADKVKTMTENVTGSNTATEQAKINTDNLAGSMAALSSKWEEFNLKLNSSNGIVRDFVDYITNAIGGLERLLGLTNDIDTNRQDRADKKYQQSNTNAYTQAIFEQETRTGVDMRSTAKVELARKAVQANVRKNLAENDAAFNAREISTEQWRRNKKAIEESLQKSYDEIAKAFTTVVVKDPPKITDNKTTTTTTTTPTVTPSAPKAPKGYNLNKILEISQEEIFSIGQQESVASMNARIKELQQTANLATDSFTRMSANAQIQEIKIKISEVDMTEVERQIQEDIANIKVPAIQISASGNIGEVTDDLNKTKEAAQGISKSAQAVGQLGNAFATISGDSQAAAAAGAMMQVLSAVAAMAAAFAPQIGKSVGPWDAIAAIVAGATAIATAASTMKGAVKMEYGGMVPGNNYSGDKVPAMLNSGEIVLNTAMQRNVASAITGAQEARAQSSKPYLNSELIYLGLNAYGKRTGKGELVFSH